MSIEKIQASLEEARKVVAALEKALIKARKEAGEPMYHANFSVHTDDDFTIEGEHSFYSEKLSGHSFKEVIEKVRNRLMEYEVTGHKIGAWHCVRDFLIEQIKSFRGSDFASPPHLHYGGNAEADISFYKEI